MEMEEETQLNRKKPTTMLGNGSSSSSSSSSYKTELCRRFRVGACALGSKCTYAHGLSDLRPQPTTNQPKLCRMSSQYRHCSYGHSCRFLHSFSSQTQHQFKNPPFHPPSPNNISHFPHAHGHAQPQPQPQPPEDRVMQTFAAATNASTSRVATSSLHKNEQPYRVKCIFKENELEKISRIYADWI